MKQMDATIVTQVPKMYSKQFHNILTLLLSYFFFYSKQMIYNSTDMNILLKEIQRVQDVLDRVKEMKKGMLGSSIIQIENEVRVIYSRIKYLTILKF